MSLDFTHDYSNHSLIDNSHRYSKLYKLSSIDSINVKCGDKLLLQTECGEYSMFIATEDTGEDGILHLSKLVEFNFTKDGESIFPTNTMSNVNSNTDINISNCQSNCHCCHK